MSPEGIGHFRFCNSFAAYHILISTVVRFEFQRVTRKLSCLLSVSALNRNTKFHPRYKFYTWICALLLA